MAGIVVISGGTGFIGQKLSALLSNAGWKVRILTRFPEKYASSTSITYHYWDWKTKKNR